MQAMKKILVINSDKDLLYNISGFLENKNYVVIGTMPGEDAVDLAQACMPGLILIDAMDGDEVCGRLKSDVRTHLIPILLMSVEINQALLKGECHADDFIEKPFVLKTLLFKIQALMA